MFDFYKEMYKVHVVDWTAKKAKQVLEAWQRRFTKVSPRHGADHPPLFLDLHVGYPRRVLPDQFGARDRRIHSHGEFTARRPLLRQHWENLSTNKNKSQSSLEYVMVLRSLQI